MNRQQRIGLLVAVVVLVLIGASCQCIHGLALDVESAARYTADHTVTDR